MKKELWLALGAYLLITNVAAFWLMGADKRRAREGEWRVSEWTLFRYALLGGALGGVLGMKVFHHKTRHWYFRFGFPLLLILQLILLAWLVLRYC